MLEVQAVIGRIQLQLMTERTKQRQHNAAILNDGVSCLVELRQFVLDRINSHAPCKHYFFVKHELLAEGGESGPN